MVLCNFKYLRLYERMRVLCLPASRLLGRLYVSKKGSGFRDCPGAGVVN